MASNQMLASKIMITMESAKTQNVPNLATAVYGIAGVTERGPWGSVTISTAMEEWQMVYGDCTVHSSDMWNTADLFYLNGGTFLITSRVTATTGQGAGRTSNAVVGDVDVPTEAINATYASVTSVATEPFTLAPADTFACTLDTGADTATFDAAAASVTGSNAVWPIDCSGGKAFVVKIRNVLNNANQSIALASDPTTSLVSALEQINSQLVGGLAENDGSDHVRIKTDQKGNGTDYATGARLEVVDGGSALALLGITAGIYNGTGDVANIASVTAADFKRVVELDIAQGSVTINIDGTVTVSSKTLGATSAIQCTASNVVTKMSFDTNPHVGSDAGVEVAFVAEGTTAGAYVNYATGGCSVKVADATSGDANYFNLTLYYGGVVMAVWPNLSMDDADDRFIERIIDSESARRTTVASNLININSVTHNRPANGTYNLSGGDDGVSGIDDGDYLGDAVKEDGLQAFNVIADLSMVSIPGRATAAIASGMVSFVEVDRGGMTIGLLDPPAGYSATQIVAWVSNTASLLESSECLAIWWPRLLVSNRWKSVFGTAKTVVVPPCGAIAGLRARIDGRGAGGKYVNAAGIDNAVLYGVIGFEDCEYGQIHEVQREDRRDIVFPKRINPITKPQFGGAIYVDGEYGLKSTGSWPFIWQRYAVNHIARSVKVGLEFSRHKDITDDLLASMNRAVDTGFLYNELRASKDARGCLKGYYVDTSPALNPPALGEAARTAIRIGLAVGNPNLWVEVKITRDNSAVNNANVAA